ncbi:Ras suppressor 1, partial [Paramuricea clavata]
ELPTSITTLSKLKFLNVGVNRLSSLPRGLGSLPCLEILELTYNNLNENSLPANFFLLADSLRALYLGDNDFEKLPADFGKLKNLQVLVLRDNDLVQLPEELGELTNLKELHLQNNRLTALPPSLGNLQLGEARHVFKAEGNSWIQAIQDQLILGNTHVFESLKSDAYKETYKSHVDSGIDPPPKNEKEKTLKRSRKKVP